MDEKLSFREIFASHQGKYSDKWDSYLDVYDRVLWHLRNKPINVLEIGVLNGGSLEIWDKYFPNVLKILGIDVNPLCAELQYESSKIKVLIGDAASEQTREVIALESNSFSLIVDDGSHQSQDVIKTFASLFPLLDSGGVYVVEDLCCSYWMEWGGGLNLETSATSFFKALIDVVNFQHWGFDGVRSDVLCQFGITTSSELEAALSRIQSVNFFNSMCVITRQAEGTDIGSRVGAGNEQSVDQLVDVPRVIYPPPQKTKFKNRKPSLLTKIVRKFRGLMPKISPNQA
jgi:hypothetical protein